MAGFKGVLLAVVVAAHQVTASAAVAAAAAPAARRTLQQTAQIEINATLQLVPTPGGPPTLVAAPASPGASPSTAALPPVPPGTKLTTPKGECSVEEGTDLAGGDLPGSTLTDVSSAEQCCERCLSTPGCGAWTYGSASGVKCFLKQPSGWTRAPSPALTSGTTSAASGAGSPPMPAGTSPAGPAGPPGTCSLQADTDFQGGDLQEDSEGARDAAACCSRCWAVDACGAWTWGKAGDNPKCFLKTASGWTQQPAPGYTSGKAQKGRR
ncbi:hypothetical protein ABPG75_010324 [Micractinium tetrahymenae]